MSDIASLQQRDKEIETRNRKLVLAGQLAFLPTGILTTLLGPMLPILAVRWHLNDAQSGSLFPVQFLSQLAGVLLSGVMLARVGFRAVFLSSLILMSAGVGTLYLGTAHFGWISVAVYGVGLGLIIPTDNLMVAEVSTGSPAAAVSLLNFFWGLGAVLCALMVAWAHVHNLLSWFLAAVALFLIILAIAMRGLPFPAKRDAAKEAIPWRKVFSAPATWLFGLVFFLYPGAETCVGGWIGSFVSRMGVRGASIGPMMPAFFWVALTVGRGAAGFVLHRVREQHLLQAGYGLGALGIALLLRASSLPEVVASTLVTGLSFAALYPIAVARLSQRFGVNARSVGAVMFALAALGPAALPLLVGVISHSTGNLRAGLA